MKININDIKFKMKNRGKKEGRFLQKGGKAKMIKRRH